MTVYGYIRVSTDKQTTGKIFCNRELIDNKVYVSLTLNWYF